jgi:hypothetical protein
MGSQLGQTLIVISGSAVFGALVLVLARRGALTLRYTLGWLAVAACVMAVVLVSPVLRPVAAAVGITPTGFLLAAASSILLLITLQITIAVSALRDATQTLAEAHALLEARVVRVEQDRMPPPVAGR